MLNKKLVDLFYLHSLWRADDDLAVFYLQGDRAPVAFYQIVFEFFHISLRLVVFDAPSTLIIPHSRASVKRRMLRGKTPNMIFFVKIDKTHLTSALLWCKMEI
jgi:hypothetical protein